MKTAPLFLLLGAVLCFGLVLADQLSSGDVYSRGSTLRPDGEGTSVWYEALEKTGTHVDRNYTPFDSLEEKNAAIVFANLPPSNLSEKEFIATAEKQAKAGARVVLLLQGFLSETIDVKSWGLKLIPTKGLDEDDEDESVVWLTHFMVSSQWKIVRAQLDNPVVIERPFGKGSIAISAATSPFLNRSLRDDRDLALLNWALGGKRDVIFDESHLGSTHAGTIVGLLRRFRMQGVAAALIVASLLFVWRSSMAWPPVQESPLDTKLHAGTVSSDALRNLLERRVPAGNLMSVCVAEWSRDFARRAGADKAQEVSQIASEKRPEIERWEKIRSIIRPQRTT